MYTAIPACAAYLWVIMPIALVLFLAGRLLLQLRDYMKPRGLVQMSVRQDQVVYRHFLDVCLIFLFTWGLQTSIHYMALLYSQDHVIGGAAYLAVISDEYDLRTQTNCQFRRYTDNITNIVLFWGRV